MTKRIIFIFAVLCTWQAQAGVRSAREDTVRHASSYDVTQLLQPMQSVYLDEVVVPMSGSGNWFVGVAGGMNAFLGTPLGCEDLFGRLKPTYSLAVGKWFTPSVGARINYSGLQFKDGTLSTQDYHHIHADLLWNLLGRRYVKQEQVRWGLAPFAGVGLLHNATGGRNPLALSYGVQAQCRISKRVSAVVELSGTTTFQDFDGYGKANRLGDHMLSLTAGLSFNIGKVGWSRTIDVTPYICRNERLMDYVNFLSEENRRYAGMHDRDRRTLAELEKILQIEGLLDAYGHILDDNEDERKSYPVNNYSGLNSLRARLKYRHWDGLSPLDTMAVQSGDKGPVPTCMYSDSTVSRNMDHAHRSLLAVESTTCMFTEGEYIGSPVYFFFRLNTARLTDPSQRLNLDELARIANKYNLSVRITGAADKETGSASSNDSLSTSRADYIATELEKRAIPAVRIVRASRGGIADHTPVEANRHTKVELFVPKQNK